jgi:hypothetical protein
VAVDVPDVHGKTDSSFLVACSDGTITAERRAGNKSWRLMLVNVKNVKSVAGGTAEVSHDGTLVTPDGDAARVEIAVG